MSDVNSARLTSFEIEACTSVPRGTEHDCDVIVDSMVSKIPHRCALVDLEHRKEQKVQYVERICRMDRETDCSNIAMPQERWDLCRDVRSH
jgi:hypothetical protein